MTTPAPGGDEGQRPDRQLVPCWHCGDDVPIDTADVVITKSGLALVCEECQT